MRARGHSAGGAQMRRMPVGFDPDTFDELAARALARRISFARYVRELVELGLET